MRIKTRKPPPPHPSTHTPINDRQDSRTKGNSDLYKNAAYTQGVLQNSQTHPIVMITALQYAEFAKALDHYIAIDSDTIVHEHTGD